VSGDHFYEFGPFRLDASAPLLLRSGDLVPLPPKALDVLVVLVDKRGTLVSRDELVSAVWPDTFVEESNLGHHISLLRKTLGNVENGQPYIETISKRGYRFTGPVRQAAVDVQLPNGDSPPAPVLQALSEVVPVEPSVMSSDGATTIPSIPSNVAIPTHARPLRGVMAGALLGVVLASAVGWFVLRSRDVAPIVAQFTVALPPGEVLVTPGYTSAAVLSPDSTRLVYASSRGGQRQLYLRSFSELEAKPIPGTRGAMSPFFSPDGQWVGFWQASKLKKIALAGGDPVTICDSGLVFGARWGSDDNILFVRRPSEGIVSVPASGGDPKIVAAVDRGKGESRFLSPVLLPGGDAMLFTVNKDSIESLHDANIVVQSLKTGERKVLIEGGMAALYSPSGHLVYGWAGALFAAPFDLKRLAITGAAVSVKQGVFVSPVPWAAHFDLSSNGSLAYVPGAGVTGKRLPVWVDRDGNAQALPLPPRAYLHPRISPDGRHVAMEVESPGHDLFTYDLTRSVLTQVTFDAGNHRPVWTPDGKRLTFNNGRTGRQIMWSIPVDRSGPEERLTSIGVGHHPSSWSPDGRVLAFDSDDDSGAGDVGVLELDRDRKPRPFAATRFVEGSPKFSPDGRWIAYSSNESGRNEIYAQAYPGPGPKLQISIGGGTDPVWARDGKELFYRNGDNMMVVEIRLQPSLAPGKPRVLWTGPYARGLSSQCSPAGTTNSNYDVTPDGQRFLMIQEEEDGLIATQIHVLPNWSEELKRQLQQEHTR
jgi:serine/threonine-protein kinase